MSRQGGGLHTHPVSACDTLRHRYFGLASAGWLDDPTRRKRTNSPPTTTAYNRGGPGAVQRPGVTGRGSHNGESKLGIFPAQNEAMELSSGGAADLDLIKAVVGWCFVMRQRPNSMLFLLGNVGGHVESAACGGLVETPSRAPCWHLHRVTRDVKRLRDPHVNRPNLVVVCVAAKHVPRSKQI